jgi:hypothetical protein
MEVTKEGNKKGRKGKSSGGRGKLRKDFLHHVSPFMGNYLQD